MDLASAKGAAAALLDLGYNLTVSQITAGVWTIQITAPAFIDAQTVNAFAAQHGAKVNAYNVSTGVVLS